MAKTVSFDSQRIVNLSLAVREYVMTHGTGCPTNHLIYALGFTAGEVAHAVDTRMIEKARGKGKGCFPFGEVPETDSTEPSITAKAFDMILAFSKGETIDRDAARDLWDARESMNATRRKA